MSNVSITGSNESLFLTVVLNSYPTKLAFYNLRCLFKLKNSFRQRLQSVNFGRRNIET